MKSIIKNGSVDEHETFYKKKHLPCSVILKCQGSNSIILPGSSVAAITTKTYIATVNVNTTHCDPCIKLEFTSNIIVPVTTTSATLNFQVFRICKNQLQPIPVGPQWTFIRFASLGTSDEVTFFVCDCNTCPCECCTYLVQVTATILAAAGGEIPTTSTVSINSAAISAIIIDSGN